AARVGHLSYDLAFVLPSLKTQPVKGHLTAAFSLSDASTPLAFDFAQAPDHLVSVQANGRALPASIENGHVVIPARALVRGDNRIAFDFVAGDAPLNRNDDFMYTLFVPARASLAMPCFDQPNLKATWRLALDIPSEWIAVSNGAEEARTAAGDHTHFSFAETAALPTYLFAFAAGKFNVETAERDGRTFHMYHRENDAAKVLRNRDAIFDLHARALDWLVSYTGIPYPFGKFDFVLIPSFQFGGMEHAGAIFYNASALMLDETATVNQRLGRANLISHETSHMWFGDLVTMKWFNDVWMKEVFANFMAAKIVDPSFPEINHPLRFFFDNYPTAYEVDRTPGANPIRQDLANLDEAGSLYGAIIYQKAPIVMRQLELLVGPDTFRDGLRAYLKRFSFANATWPDLIKILSPPSPPSLVERGGLGWGGANGGATDLSAWSHAWVDEPGRPTIRTDIRIADDRIQSLAFEQRDPRGRSIFWPERLTVILGYASPPSVKTLDVTLSGPHTDVAEATGLPAPQWVLPVGGGLGYGAFELDPASEEALIRTLPDIADPAGPLSRGATLVTLWEIMLDGHIAPARIRDLLLAALPRETDELNVQAMLADLRTIFWRFTAPDARVSMAPRIEETLRAGLGAAKTVSVRAAWFKALRSVALTPATIDWLASVWRREVAIDGLPLAETDEADLALELAVRDHPKSEEILHAQLDRFANPDRKARFAFVMPAVSSDATARDAFFESLKHVENRAHEAWVLEAAGYLHHPLRADASEKYIRPALDLVREIQRTGDIFFPKRWADATLGGHRSPRAAADVRAFLDGLPADYPPRLRWVVESSADMLVRAAKLEP
ncbi:MAG TPA: M1 family aminopeptidase, partial [Polyangiaceae bacterium]|nr:M1 family aminopeptidase [Polyangiaceae bacterium]